MTKRKILSISLLVDILICIIYLASSFILVSECPVDLNAMNLDFKNNYVGYKIEQDTNKIVYTRYENQNSLIQNLRFTYIPKIVTTYSFENGTISNVSVKYHYLRASDAKKDYDNKDYDFFNSSKSIEKNVITEDMTEFYKNKTAEEIIDTIKSNYNT